MMAIGVGRWGGVLLLGCFSVVSMAPARADPLPPVAGPEDGTLAAKRRELAGIQADMSVSDAERRKLSDEIEAIRTDRVRLAAALIETTQRLKDAEGKAAALEDRLSTLQGSQTALQQSLEARRGVLGEVLASLQRLGRKPPPALLVAPDDILRTIRTSMLLGAVLPELRGQAEALAADLAELQRVRQSMAAEHETLTGALAGLAAERRRLDALVGARQAAELAAQAALGTQQGRAGDLAQKATSLKDLVAQMESDLSAAHRAGEAARTADEARRRLAEADADSIRQRVAAGPFRDPARLAPALAFADAKTMLALPVAGRMIKSYGAADGFGGTEKGLSLATRPQAVVSAPTDGWIAFSGPYRTYGQILIMNAGDGYYIVMAGMTSVTVTPGQFVLAGEPVAVMGDGSVRTAAAIALGAAEPILYVEFRKDGTAVDPTPWWAKAELEKVRG